VLTYRGLSEFFGKCWTQYMCRSFVWGLDHHDVAKHYARLIYEAAEIIQPPPELVEIKRYSEEAGDSLFDEVALRGGLVIDKGNALLRSHLAIKDDTQRARGYHALRTLLMAFTRMPYRG
jgi:hypothetical protein